MNKQSREESKFEEVSDEREKNILPQGVKARINTV
jgi:hypothetical protein